MALTKISRGLLSTGVSDSSDATAITIDSSERVGIGTTSPAVELHIHDEGGLARVRLSGTASAADNFEFGQGTTGVTNAGFEIYDVDASAARFNIDTNGNIGIGTSSPSMKVNISHGDQDGLRFNCANTAETFIDFGDTDDNDIGRISYDHADNHMAFRTNNAERMRIDSNGNLFAGKTVHDFDAVGIELFPSTGYMNITRNQGTQLYLHRMNNDGAFVEFWQTNNLEGFIDVSSGTVRYENYSDYRMKQKVSDLSSCLDRVKALRPVTFEYKRHKGYTHEGFIAHEVQEVLPQAVEGEKDAVDENGDPVYQSYDKSLLIPLLTKAIQELSTKLEAAEARITTLEG